jgi:alkaline phosphatase D
MALAAQLHQSKATLGLDSNLIVLTGDSHNAWANNLRYREVDLNTGVPTGNVYDAGVEIGTTSVSSIGMETSLKAMLVGAGIISEEQFDIDLFTGIFNYYIDDNAYAELQHRGYSVITFTPDQAVAEFRLIADALSPSFNPASDVTTTTVTVKNGANKIDSIVG